MSGSFKNTNQYINTVDSLIKATNSKINNPYYLYTDKKPTPVTYWHIDNAMSTLDQSSKLNMDNIGVDSPFRFNRIDDFILYGLDRILVDYDATDFGLESQQISGDAILLPNTIRPNPGDYFAIKYVKELILFIVTKVTTDTLDTGANIYKIEYQLNRSEVTSIDDINRQVLKTFKFITSNVGTQFNCLLEDSSYNLIENMDRVIEVLCSYFNTFFFDERTQTYLYTNMGQYMYDPYLIEFLKRTQVLSDYDQYIHIEHAVYCEKTFSIDYMRTVFYALENPDLDVEYDILATGQVSDDPNSLFARRLQNYYTISYKKTADLYTTKFPVLYYDVLEAIKCNKYFDPSDTKAIYNLWVAHFNKDTNYITGTVLNNIRGFMYMDNMECFYALPITIYILKAYIKTLMQ